MHMTTTMNRLGAPLRYAPHWHPKHEERLRKELKTKGYRRLAHELGRTIDALKAKARELGLTSRED